MASFRTALVASALPLIGAMSLLAPDVHAGGFALSEMSAASLGNAHAGGAAAAEDASTLYFNPAGMTRLQGRQFMAAISGIGLSADFRNAGSVTGTGAPLTGGNGGDAGSWSFVPALYHTMQLRPELTVGIGLQVPFGLTTDYNSDWVGRYQALKSELKTININPSIAYKLNDQLSLGAGISAQYVDVELSRAIDFGSICVGTLGAPACVPGGFVPQARDGKVTVEGDDWGFGFNLGALFELNEYARFGIAYRSRIQHDLGGDATYSLPTGLPAPLAASPTFTNTGASADLDLPESLSLSAFMQLDRKWSAMADVTWTHWSRFKELRINFNNGAPTSVTPENFRNTYRVSLALNYRHSDTWKFRGGIAYDQSPVEDEFRTPRVPDENRIWLAFGAQYRPTRMGSLDIGFAHLFVKDSSINKAEPPVGGTLIGEYDSNVNILSVQYNHAF